MIVKDADGREYRLRFTHYRRISDLDARRGTLASLTPVGPGREVPVDQRSRIPLAGSICAVSICSERDQFSRAKGRSLSLLRVVSALAKLTSPANAEAVLDAYENRPRKPTPAEEVAASLGRDVKALLRVVASGAQLEDRERDAVRRYAEALP